MRVLILDSDAAAARALAASIERLLPDADVLRYDDAGAARSALAEQQPDVVFVAPTVAGADGPTVLGTLAGSTAASGSAPLLVGLVDSPDPEWSQRYVAAGSALVAARPVDDLALRTAFRQRGGGIDPTGPAGAEK